MLTLYMEEEDYKAREMPKRKEKEGQRATGQRSTHWGKKLPRRDEELP